MPCATAPPLALSPSITSSAHCNQLPLTSIVSVPSSTRTFVLPKTPPWLYRITLWLYRNQSHAINQSNCSISNRQTLKRMQKLLTLHVRRATIVARIIIVHGKYSCRASIYQPVDAGSASLGVLLRNFLCIYVSNKVGTTCRHRKYNCHLTSKLFMAETKQLIVIDCY